MKSLWLSFSIYSSITTLQWRKPEAIGNGLSVARPITFSGVYERRITFVLGFYVSEERQEQGVTVYGLRLVLKTRFPFISLVLKWKLNPTDFS